MLGVGRWLASWKQLGVSDSAALRELHAELLARYAEPHRHYHTEQHLVECLEGADALRALAVHPAEVDVALWFHDAIYDTRRSDNEERSGAWALAAALSLRAPADVAQRMDALIMTTRHIAAPATADAQVVADADLFILGADAARFDEYDAQVRKEYDWVPAPTFRARRARVLQAFLDRRAIYCTPPFVERYEAQARHNLRRALDRLDAAA